ncbi:MAG: hypothetical protein ACTS5I_11850 [Rhodanobacter sp.]
MVSVQHRIRFFLSLGLAAAAADVGFAQSPPDDSTVTLDAVTILSPRVANQEPVATVAMPVSALRFEPAVDLQARNFAEGQADVAIRGGTFANTGWTLSGIPLYDPQTGQYLTPDGQLHQVTNLAAGGTPKSWKDLLPI